MFEENITRRSSENSTGVKFDKTKIKNKKIFFSSSSSYAPQSPGSVLTKKNLEKSKNKTYRDQERENIYENKEKHAKRLTTPLKKAENRMWRIQHDEYNFIN